MLLQVSTTRIGSSGRNGGDTVTLKWPALSTEPVPIGVLDGGLNTETQEFGPISGVVVPVIIVDPATTPPVSVTAVGVAAGDKLSIVVKSTSCAFPNDHVPWKPEGVLLSASMGLVSPARFIFSVSPGLAGGGGSSPLIDIEVFALGVTMNVSAPVPPLKVTAATPAPKLIAPVEAPVIWVALIVTVRPVASAESSTVTLAPPPRSVTVTALLTVVRTPAFPMFTVFAPPPRVSVSGVPMPGNTSPVTLTVSAVPPMIVVFVVVALNVEWILKVFPAGPPFTV